MQPVSEKSAIIGTSLRSAMELPAFVGLNAAKTILELFGVRMRSCQVPERSMSAGLYVGNCFFGFSLEENRNKLGAHFVHGADLDMELS